MTDNIDIDSLRFPIGEFQKPVKITPLEIKKWIASIRMFPQHLSDLTRELADADLEKTYRVNGWTIRQVVHHCADSHINSLIRFKWTLTEETPEIKAYYEDRWANLPDSSMPVAASLSLLEGLHARWVVLLESLEEAQLQREFIHPEHGKHFSLAENIGVYAWHCEHHLAHVRLALGK